MRQRVRLIVMISINRKNLGFYYKKIQEIIMNTKFSLKKKEMLAKKKKLTSDGKEDGFSLR